MEQYINMIRRWFWLIVLVTLVASATTYWFSRQEQRVYEATARLIVGPGVDSPSPDLNALRTSGQLLQTYAELATTRPVLEIVNENLGLNRNPGVLRRQIDIKFNKEAQLLTVSAQDDDAAVAVAIANTVAETLVQMSPSGANSPAALLKAQMRGQAERLEQDIATIEARIVQLEADSGMTEDLAQQRLYMDQLSEQRARLADANRTLAILYESLQQGATNQVKIVEPADNASLIPSQQRLQVLIGALAGMILAVVLVLVIEFFDDTVKSVDMLAEATDVPILSTLARHKALQGSGRQRLVVQALPNSQAAEGYRLLGTKLLLSCGAEPPRSVLLGSTHTNEDTGEIAANLAVVLAQTGKRVILVDANLNRPSLSGLLGIADTTGGLTEVLSGKVDEPNLLPVGWMPGLALLASGPVLKDSFALLSSSRMSRLLQELEEKADIVLLAASSLLSFADSLFLATKAGGVLLVVHNGRTRRDIIGAVVENLRSLNTNIIGSIFDHNRSSSLPAFPWPAASDRSGSQKRKVEEVVSEPVTAELAKSSATD